MSDKNNEGPVRMWHAVVCALEGTMTKATFDTWVKPTAAIALHDDTLVVGVRNGYALEWLNNRLRPLIERTMHHALDAPPAIQFVVRPEHVADATGPANDLRAGDVLVDLIESPLAPWLQVQKYAIWYWQPLIGAVAFSTWLMLRTLDKKNEGRGPRRQISVDVIAKTIKCHRQSLTGRSPAEKLAGAFQILNDEKLARIDVIGKGHDAIYWARVLNAVPLLTPTQVSRLDPLIRERHDIFLHDFSVDAERWHQLEIETLVQD